MIRKLYMLIAAFALLASPALADVRIVVPSHDIARGQVIGESDLTYGTVVGSALMGGTVTSFDAVKGMEARRTLHAGESLKTDDVRRPIIVTKGQTVTMSFSAPGVELSAVGRAMSEGGMGDTVTIQNPASFRMVSAIVTGPGTAEAAGAPEPFLTASK